MVADGGVFSPRRALWGERPEMGSLISKRADGVGVPFRDEMGSGSLTNGSLVKASLLK